jgi:alanine dehydrogenase
VPNTSTYALTNATLPYVIELATSGARDAAAADSSLAAGINTIAGRVPNATVAEALGRPATPLDDCWSGASA